MVSSCGLDDTQALQGHAMHFISAMFEDYSLYEMCCHLSSNMWSLIWRSKLYWTVPEAFLRNECGRLGMSIPKSTVCHEKPRNGLFA